MVTNYDEARTYIQVHEIKLTSLKSAVTFKIAAFKLWGAGGGTRTDENIIEGV